MDKALAEQPLSQVECYEDIKVEVSILIAGVTAHVVLCYAELTDSEGEHTQLEVAVVVHRAQITHVEGFELLILLFELILVNVV